jgi:amino acid transporter
MKLLGHIGDACMWIVGWAPIVMCAALVLLLVGIIIGGINAMAGVVATIPFVAIAVIGVVAFGRAWQLDHRKSEPRTEETDGSGI